MLLIGVDCLRWHADRHIRRAATPVPEQPHPNHAGVLWPLVSCEFGMRWLYATLLDCFA